MKMPTATSLAAVIHDAGRQALQSADFWSILLKQTGCRLGGEVTDGRRQLMWLAIITKFLNEDRPMATRKQTKRATKTPRKNAVGGQLKPAKRAPKPSAPQTAKAQTDQAQSEPASKSKLSLLNAAHQILAASNHPLTTKQIIEQAAQQQLWTSPGGKTPHNTLYASLLREINTQGDTSRFAKVDRGLFNVTSK